VGVRTTTLSDGVDQVISLVFESFSGNHIDLHFIFEFLLDSLGFCQHIIGSGHISSCISEISGSENVFGYGLLVNEISIC
jgi:hypothetical protein